MDKDINIKVKVWRQNGQRRRGILKPTPGKDIPGSSFLETSTF